MQEQEDKLSQDEIESRLRKLEEYERREKEQAQAEKLLSFKQALRWIETWLYSTIDQFEAEGRDSTLTKEEWDRVIRRYAKAIEQTGNELIIESQSSE